MNVMTSPDLYEGHRVRVMWDRRAGIWHCWPFSYWRKHVPVYVFIAYVRGEDRPLRICLRGDGESPFIIRDPLAYDGGYFNHGPYANAARYDQENPGHTLAGLFDMLHKWAGGDAPEPAEEQRVHQALEGFYAWIWREHRRDRAMLPGSH